MVASPVPFSNLQTPMPSLNKSTTFGPIADFTICVVSPEKEKDMIVKK